MTAQKWHFCVGSADISESSEAKAWITKTVAEECQRIRVSGARAIPLPTKNCGILVEADDMKETETSNFNRSGNKRRRVKVVNRIEISSGMDFRSIGQIMVSEPLEYPFRPGYLYVHILCFTAASNTMALLVPYVYAPYLKKAPIEMEMIEKAEAGQLVEEEVVSARKGEKDYFENNLKEWLLINQSQARARHSIKEFHSIG